MLHSILPVLDLKAGRVVRGVAGRRDEYQPVVSQITGSNRPLAVAQALRNHFGFQRFYVADLDAIAGTAPSWPSYELLHAAGLRLWIDAGVRTPRQAMELAATPVERIVVGLESVHGPEALRTICRDLGATRVVFSLDLKAGVPLGDAEHWRAADAWEIAQRAADVGVTQILVLDLARVGVGSGTGTEELCRHLRATYPALEITAGGGVRDADDVRCLHASGVNHVLVASALHDGRLTPDDVRRLGTSAPRG